MRNLQLDPLIIIYWVTNNNHFFWRAVKCLPSTIYINKISLDEFIFQNISPQVFRENESNVRINEKNL